MKHLLIHIDEATIDVYREAIWHNLGDSTEVPTREDAEVAIALMVLNAAHNGLDEIEIKRPDWSET